MLAGFGAVMRPLAAQHAPSPGEERHPARPGAFDQAARPSGASDHFDATYYHLWLTLDFAQSRLTGTTRAEGRFTAPGNELRLDLLSNMEVTAVRDEAGRALSFTHANDVLAIRPGRTIGAGGRVAVEIDYRGHPQASGFGAFAFAERDGTPVAWSLSEPYGARAWWPGKDHPSDKADSARITVTVPRPLRVGSNGLLASIRETAGGVTYDWVTRYPIAPYLLSIAAGPYAVFEQMYVRPDSLAARLGPLALPLLHYVYAPNGTASLPVGWAEAAEMLPVFERWFGPYPFSREKYGHAQFGWGGGMEHQTMSSMGGSGVGLVAHELAHQWFGDAVTMRTWPHLWLNEGFASYAEILYWEARPDRYPGLAEATRRVDQFDARSAQGTLVVTDTLNVRNLFAGSRVYNKGSVVLHMLRRVLGEVDFRATLQAYLADPALAYGTAETADFQRVAEIVSGRPLGFFFRQWVTEGTGYPAYAVTFTSAPAAGGYDVTVLLRQTQALSLSNVDVFEMPVTFALRTARGEHRFEVVNDRREQVFVFHVEDAPEAVVFDPDFDLLRNDDVVAVGTGPEGPDGGAFTLLAAPNPTRGPFRLTGTVPTAGPMTVRLVDVLGRPVRLLWEGPVAAGLFALNVDLSGLPAGVYLVAARTGTAAWAAPLVVAP